MRNVMKRPCRNCGVQVIDRMICQAGRGCQKSKAKPITQTVAPAPAVVSQAPKLVNRIAILLDESGSMQRLTDSLIKYANEQIAAIKQKAWETKQATYISVYTFGGTIYPVNVLQNGAFIEQAIYLSRANYQPMGQTPLIDCMLRAINDLSFHQPDAQHDVSYLIMLLTDGGENSSSMHGTRMIEPTIAEKNASDRWTFAYAGPRQAQGYLANLGISAGNFTSWDQSVKGMEDLSHVTMAGVSSYYLGRSAGVRSTKSFFPVNLTGVDPNAIRGLTNWNNQFRRLTVTQDTPISDFMNRTIGSVYQIGRGFYELTKAEDIQDHKDLAIVSMKSGEIYGGREAKNLLKLPMGGTIRVKPGDLGDYKVFVQSTSMNRKLIGGTEFLYKEK